MTRSQSKTIWLLSGAVIILAIILGFLVRSLNQEIPSWGMIGPFSMEPFVGNRSSLVQRDSIALPNGAVLAAFDDPASRLAVFGYLKAKEVQNPVRINFSLGPKGYSEAFLAEVVFKRYESGEGGGRIWFQCKWSAGMETGYIRLQSNGDPRDIHLSP